MDLTTASCSLVLSSPNRYFTDAFPVAAARIPINLHS